jgi:hypothetical protein
MQPSFPALLPRSTATPRRWLAAVMALGLLGAAACTDDQSGTHDEPDGPALTGDELVTEGTSPPPGDDPELPGDAPGTPTGESEG